MSWYKCFYWDFGPKEAVDYLMTPLGVDGSFLVRPSSEPRQYTLSARVRDDVYHIRILWNGDSYEFSETAGEHFASIDDLIEHHMESNSLRLQNGINVNLQYPLQVPYQPPVSQELWYHGNITGNQAEELIRDQQNASFLVRESKTSLGNYALTVKTNKKVKHLKIYAVHSPTSYTLERDQKKFGSLEELVRHYRNGMIDSDNEYICLEYPVQISAVFARDFPDWVMKSQQKQGHEKEWEELTSHETSMKLRESIAIGRQPANSIKNRYKNILPYDSHRVKLQKPKDQSDYINASRVTHIDKEIADASGKAYISTQGPLPNTVEDFWYMVVQEKSTVILMIAKEIEKERKKCEKYWPDRPMERRTWGQATVTLLSVRQPDPAFLERHLRVEIEGKEAHDVVQFQFILWPDFSIPDDTNIDQVLHYLARVKTVRDDCMYDGHPLTGRSPTVVHCSAGIGRSGAVMVIDMISDQLDRYHGNKSFDIKKTVTHCRKHRHGMVQTIDQYKFITKTIARKSTEICGARN